jgi:hypothetical protein
VCLIKICLCLGALDPSRFFDQGNKHRIEGRTRAATAAQPVCWPLGFATSQINRLGDLQLAIGVVPLEQQQVQGLRAPPSTFQLTCSGITTGLFRALLEAEAAATLGHMLSEGDMPDSNLLRLLHIATIS